MALLEITEHEHVHIAEFVGVWIFYSFPRVVQKIQERLSSTYGCATLACPWGWGMRTARDSDRLVKHRTFIDHKNFHANELGDFLQVALGKIQFASTHARLP